MQDINRKACGPLSKRFSLLRLPECMSQGPRLISLCLAVLDAQRLERPAKGVENHVEFIRHLR